MTTKRNIITTILAAALLVSMTGMAFAGSPNDIWTDPTEQVICVGEAGTYTVYVNTSEMGEHTIWFKTLDPCILANLTGFGGVDTGAPSPTGNATWTPTHTAGTYATYQFTYTVQPQSGCGLIDGKEYPMQIGDGYLYGPVRIDASVIISTTVVPELATFALVSVGAVVGLLALGRRKD
jgi:hypothetical protein